MQIKGRQLKRDPLPPIGALFIIDRKALRIEQRPKALGALKR